MGCLHHRQAGPGRRRHFYAAGWRQPRHSAVSLAAGQARHVIAGRHSGFFQLRPCTWWGPHGGRPLVGPHRAAGSAGACCPGRFGGWGDLRQRGHAGCRCPWGRALQGVAVGLATGASSAALRELLAPTARLGLPFHFAFLGRRCGGRPRNRRPPVALAGPHAHPVLRPFGGVDSCPYSPVAPQGQAGHRSGGRPEAPEGPGPTEAFHLP